MRAEGGRWCIITSFTAAPPNPALPGRPISALPGLAPPLLLPGLPALLPGLPALLPGLSAPEPDREFRIMAWAEGGLPPAVEVPGV